MLGNLKDKFEKQDLEKLEVEKLDELEQYILHKIYIIGKSVEENLKITIFIKCIKIY